MPPTALSVADLVRRPDWPAVRKRGVVQVVTGEISTVVTLSMCPTSIGGEMAYLICPVCRKRRARRLYQIGSALACSTCAGHRHPDQQLSSGWWDRQVVRRARQIVRLDQRLLQRGLGWNKRRKLHRRRRRLLVALAAALDDRRQKLVSRARARSIRPH